MNNIAKSNYGLTPEQQASVREEFQKLLDDLKQRNWDYYDEYMSAPAAKSHHQNYYRGLVEHSGKFAMWLYGRSLRGDIDITLQECARIGFLHDFCKLFLYESDGVGGYDIDYSIYDHHAKRSIELAEELGYKLSQKEKICILLHMAGGWWNQEDEDLLTEDDRRQIARNIRLISAVQWADMKACE